MTGNLIYDPAGERLAICDGMNTLHLHCGETIEVSRQIITDKTNTIWIPARIEYSHEAEEWYLVGMYKPGEIPSGLLVRN